MSAAAHRIGIKRPDFEACRRPITPKAYLFKTAAASFKAILCPFALIGIFIAYKRHAFEHKAVRIMSKGCHAGIAG